MFDSFFSPLFRDISLSPRIKNSIPLQLYRSFRASSVYVRQWVYLIIACTAAARTQSFPAASRLLSLARIFGILYFTVGRRVLLARWYCLRLFLLSFFSFHISHWQWTRFIFGVILIVCSRKLPRLARHTIWRHYFEDMPLFAILIYRLIFSLSTHSPAASQPRHGIELIATPLYSPGRTHGFIVTKQARLLVTFRRDIFVYFLLLIFALCFTHTGFGHFVIVKLFHIRQCFWQWMTTFFWCLEKEMP